MPGDRSATPPQTSTVAAANGAVILTAGGLAAAFAVASCCGLPFILTTLGLGTAWFYGIAVVAAPHRAVLLPVAALCLAGGAALLWRQRPTVAVCAPGGVCTRRSVRALTALALAAGIALLYLGYAYA